MSSTDAAFAGSIPGLYDRCLGPLLFEPYAREVARRAASLQPRRMLETAAGTGIVTRALHRTCPDAEIVATDLNQAMLDVAAQRVVSDRVRFQQADALDLPLDDGEFDLVVCQFGVMFYPDRVRGNTEAKRVLRDGGRYLLVVWDALDRNPVSRIVHDAVAALFPEDPPGFFARTPFGYAEPDVIEHDLLAAGFKDLELETVPLQSLPTSAIEAATGLVAGSPLRAEVEERDAAGLERVIAAAAKSLMQLERDGALESGLSAHVVTATQ
jgi:SAM-dependent methyltransferase